MTSPRAASGLPLTPRRAPEAYVRAEIASFPLVSLEAFRHAIEILDPTLGASGDDPDECTGKLWAACEDALEQHASGWSLDRLIHARDFFWFGCKPGSPKSATRCAISMRSYLLLLNETFLEPYPGTTMLRHSFDTNSFDASLHYRWLTFALPEDMLLAATPLEPAPQQVNLERPLLLQYLVDRGAAEIHQHINGGMSFPLLWASVLARLSSPALQPGDADSPGLELIDGETQLRWLLATAVARCVLAEFLLQSPRPEARLEDFLTRRLGGNGWTFRRGRTLVQALHALSRGNRAELPDFYDLRELYAELHPEAERLDREPPRSIDEVWRRCDPIASRLGLKNENAGERWLMRHGMRYLEQQERWEQQCARDGKLEPQPLRFRRIFWQVQRVRCIYYRSIVQRPLTAGLQWFIRFFNRLGWARKPLEAVRPEVSHQVAGRGRRLSSLEVRISPTSSPFDLAQTLLDFTHSWMKVLEKAGTQAHPRREPEFGVLLHFNKERDPESLWFHGVPPAAEAGTHAEPSPSGGVRLGGRFADFVTKQSQMALATADLLHAVPEVLWLLRGVDVASDELSVPTWVLVPLYHFLHYEAALASTSPRAKGAPPLRLTAHVGEDFRHLMEGLRHIFECVQYLLERFGGRLGHAVALGVEPRLWAESTGSVLMTARNRLLDLLFEWRLYSGYRVMPGFRAEAPPGRPEQVENHIRELSHGIFRKSYEPHQLAEFHHVLHRLLCHPESRLPAEAGGLEAFAHAEEMLRPDQVRDYALIRELVTAYRTDEGIFKRGEVLVDVTLDEAEVSALYAVQNALRCGVSLRNIVVEVNPSSNLLIGDLMDLRNHPILRLFPPERKEGAPPPVTIAVGSDDPITFSTWLLHEYSLLYDAALAAGYPDRVVQTWLEKIQRMGMDARFTVGWRPSGMAKAEELCRGLEDYLLKPSMRVR